MTKKSLTECSLQDMSTAIEKAIAEITGSKVEANISQFNVLDFDSFNAKNKFELKVSLDVGIIYGESGKI